MRFVSACFCWRDAFFLSANNFCAETVCMKSSHHNFKTKQQAVEGDETCVCFASFGPRSFRIGLQPVSKPSTMTLKLTKQLHVPRTHGVRQFQNFWYHANRYLWAHGSFVLCPNKANKASAQCAWRSERRKEANRPSSISWHRRRNVCKWTVVRVEKQAARCRQIGSFPWWRWQTILKTARLWTPVTLSFLDGSS